MERKRSIFTAEGYRRLAKNPFVDRKMLQFVRDKAKGSSDAASPDVSTGGSRTTAHRKSVISDEAAKLIAATIRSLLRE